MALATRTIPGPVCHLCPGPHSIAGPLVRCRQGEEALRTQARCHWVTDCRLGIISWQMGQPRAFPTLPQIALGPIMGGVLLHSTDPQGSIINDNPARVYSLSQAQRVYKRKH